MDQFKTKKARRDRNVWARLRLAAHARLKAARAPPEKPLWVRTFRTVEELRLALIEFGKTYNENWLIERHGHRSPTQFRREQA